MRKVDKQSLAMMIQCALAIIIGYFIFLWQLGIGGDNPKKTIIAALVGGVVGSWLLMKLYVLIRYGWKAMRSMTWDAD